MKLFMTAECPHCDYTYRGWAWPWKQAIYAMCYHVVTEHGSLSYHKLMMKEFEYRCPCGSEFVDVPSIVQHWKSFGFDFRTHFVWSAMKQIGGAR